METDATDKQPCFVLFQKFVREVSLGELCIFISSESCDYLLHNYNCIIYQVLVRMKQYKDDLLASCLQLLLSLPKELVELEFEGLVPALQVHI